MNGILGFNLIKNYNKTEESLYKYWRFRMMFSMMVGYAAFYFVRQNLYLAMPIMESNLGFSKSQLGMIASTFGIVYGFGKFISGVIGDRSSSRTFMALGLGLSALTNIFMGIASSFWLLMVIWAMNSCFQSTGAPSCAKMLTHWFSPKEIGTRWAIWSSSQQMGSALIGVGIAYFLPTLGWRYAFYIPGIICILIATLVYSGVRDDPQVVGLPNLGDFEGGSHIIEDECAHMTSFQILVKRVLRNKMVWAMCIASFFLYFVRMGCLFWAPMFLCQAKGNSLLSAGCQVAVFNCAGIFGSILAGVLSDKFFKGRRGRAGFFYMIGLASSILAMWFMPSGLPQLHTFVMLLVGFFVAGPQTMIGVASVDFASKKAAGSASGLTGTFGYMGTTLAGIGLARLADSTYGWSGVFALLLIASVAGALCFVFTWNARSQSLENIKNKDAPLKLGKAA